MKTNTQEPTGAAAETGAPPALTRESLLLEEPKLYQAILEEGVTKERARIREIRELGIVGHKELVERAMFEEPMSAMELSMAYTKAENAVKTAALKGRLEESAGAAVPPDPVEPGKATGDAAQEALVVSALAGKIPDPK
jgi:hypothetical protein